MDWFAVTNAAEIPSPALLIHPERVEANLGEMLRIAGGPARLRPHVKTHKLAELVRRQAELGIMKFKGATIAEAELAAANGARDVLLAQQPVGPNTGRLVRLAELFPGTRFAATVDDAEAVRALAAANTGRPALPLLVDLDLGQHRTGVAPGPAALALIGLLTHTPGVQFGGLHAYDGHIHAGDPAARAAQCEAAFAPVLELQERLDALGLGGRPIVAGGTPTFSQHARRERWGALTELSPGTTVLWDAGYSKKFPDLKFLAAAVLLTRVVSRPAANRLCLDLGHKAVASEMPPPRVVFLNLPDATPVMHNEEHLVVETPHAAGVAVGAELYALPWHVCPTVALHAEAWVVTEGVARGRWPVKARARRLTV